MPTRTTVPKRSSGNGLAAPKSAAVAATRKARRVQKGFIASIFPSAPVPTHFGVLVEKLEKEIKAPIWILIQNSPSQPRSASPFDEIGFSVFKGFQDERPVMRDGTPMALLIESQGGDAHHAYRIARLFQRRTNNLTIIVPQYAKSAATLMALGATHLILGRDAELGPLDVQIYDRDRETYGSALDAVQALERLNVFALNAVDQSMMLYLARMGKRTDVLLPHVLDYVTKFLRPLLDKIDTVDFTKKSRELKVAEDYAFRLMKPNYGIEAAHRIAAQLVERYATHGFVIDRREARARERLTAEETFGLGLKIDRPSAKVEKLFNELRPYLDDQTIVGRINRVP